MTFDAIIQYLTTPKRNLDATTAPTISDDSTLGYGQGSLWVDTVAKKVYFCQDAATGAAVWVSALDTPGLVTDNAIVAWDGTDGTALKNSLVTVDPATGNLEGTPPADGLLISGQRRFPPGAANPAGAAAEGDAYYNTLLDTEMRYDAGRAKWMSMQTIRFYFGRSGITGVGAFFDGAGGVQMGPTNGFPIKFPGTIVAIGASKDAAPAGPLSVQVTLDGVDIAGAVFFTGANADVTVAANADYAIVSGAELLGVRNASPGNVRDVMGWVDVRWRTL